MIAYFPLLAIAFLLFTPLIMLILQIYRPRFAYFWLVAVLGALLAVPLVFLARQVAPYWLPLLTWLPASFFSTVPVLLVDALSWPYALALVTLVLAVILTDVARAYEAQWSAWANSLVLAGLGLLAVLAGNPLTLLLAWAAIDIAELLMLLSYIGPSRNRERVVVTFTTRVAGILMLVWGLIVARGSGSTLTFDQIPQTASLYLFLASGLRLGVVPIQPPLIQEVALRRGLGTMLRLVPAAASLVLLARTAPAGVPDIIAPVLLALAGSAAVYAGFLWLVIDNELEGRSYWVLGMASLSMAAAVRGQPVASQAFGLALLLPGGLLFLLSARHRFQLPLLVLAILSLSMLPLTPTWEAARLYEQVLNVFSALFLIAQVFLLMGYIWHALYSGESLAGVERWVWLIYPWGLVLLPLAHILLGWWIWQASSLSVTINGLLPGVLLLGLTTLGMVLSRRIPQPTEAGLDKLKSVLSLEWLYRVLWGIYRGVGELVAFITNVLEGEGGVLWTLLLVTLLVAFLVQRGLGG